MSEHLSQSALFEFFRNPAVRAMYPEADLLFSTLNGVHLSKSQAGKAKASGLLAGVYDVILPVARGGFHGLAVEMKHGKNGLTSDQEWFGRRLREEGWKTVESWTWIDAKDCIVEYLSQK